MVKIDEDFFKKLELFNFGQPKISDSERGKDYYGKGDWAPLNYVPQTLAGHAILAKSWLFFIIPQR